LVAGFVNGVGKSCSGTFSTTDSCTAATQLSSLEVLLLPSAALMEQYSLAPSLSEQPFEAVLSAVPSQPLAVTQYRSDAVAMSFNLPFTKLSSTQQTLQVSGDHAGRFESTSFAIKVGLTLFPCFLCLSPLTNASTNINNSLFLLFLIYLSLSLPLSLFHYTSTLRPVRS
jgi:hypothetical protein